MLSLPVDSAVLMALMNELEDTFAVYIEEEAAFSFESVGDVSEYIRQRLAAKAGRADAP
jgi:acyl carrier protein